MKRKQSRTKSKKRGSQPKRKAQSKRKAPSKQSKPKKRDTKRSAKKQAARSSKRKAKKEARGSRTRLRRIRKGVTYLITKKTNDDQFILRPDGTVNQVLLFLLILNVNKHGMLLHAFSVMSNHIHLVVTDVEGRLPKFMREFLGESGKAIKIATGSTRRVWSPERYSAVELLDRDAVERMITYCQTNPTKAGLTLPEDWPGLTSARNKFGDTLIARKPEFYFGEKRPNLVSCELAPIPRRIGVSLVAEGAKGAETAEAEVLSPKAYRERCKRQQAKIEQRVAQSVEEILRKREADGKSELLGKERVLAASRLRRGTTYFRDGISPMFATTNAELMKQAKDAYKRFQIEHNDAKESYIAGKTGVFFPEGTYGYRELLRVNVREGGSAV